MTIPANVAALVALARREHEFQCPRRPRPTDEPGDAERNACDCGADEHNARVDALAAALTPQPLTGDAAGIVEDFRTIALVLGPSIVPEAIEALARLEALARSQAAEIARLTTQRDRSASELVEVTDQRDQAYDAIEAARDAAGAGEEETAAEAIQRLSEAAQVAEREIASLRDCRTT